MNANTICLLALGAMLALVGCNKAESPAKVQSDIAKARDAATTNDARAVEHEAKVDASASSAIARAEDTADVKMDAASAATDVTAAQGANGIALAKCEALSGDLQSACREKAKAALDMAKAKAKVLKGAGN